MTSSVKRTSAAREGVGMKRLSSVVLVLAWACWFVGPASMPGPPTAAAQPPRPAAPTRPWPPDLPVYDHVVIVVEENKDYEQIIDNPAAPYINGTLRAEGANLTQMYGEEHRSQGNYFWLFSGSNHNIGF